MQQGLTEDKADLVAREGEDGLDLVGAIGHGIANGPLDPTAPGTYYEVYYDGFAKGNLSGAFAS